MTEKGSDEVNLWMNEKEVAPRRRRMLARFSGMLGDYRLPNSVHLDFEKNISDKDKTVESKKQDLN